MPPVITYQCMYCREELRFCDVCRMYVHAPRWEEHADYPHCWEDGIGTNCWPVTRSIHEMVKRTLLSFGLCACALLLAWLLWAQVVAAWDASYRAGWLR